MSLPYTNESMSIDHQQPAVKVQRLDFTWASLFVTAAALILGIVTPVYIRFEPHTLETLAVILVSGILLGWGVLRHKGLLVLLPTLVLFLTIFTGITTRPTTFNTLPETIWPARLLLIILVISGWLLFLAPSGWARRAVIAFSIPTTLILLLLGGSALIGRSLIISGTGEIRMNRNFAAQSLVINSRGTLYAGDLDGGLVWVFDSSGSLQGTIRPASAPPLPTPGPGIIPNGFETELGLPSLGVPSPTAIKVSFSFCGMAADSQDNLYLLDTTDPTHVKLMRFNGEGNLTAQWPAPNKYQPSNDCLAVDANYIYLSSIGGRIYVLDYNGKEVKQVELPFQPWAITTSGGEGTNRHGTLLAAGPGSLASIEVSGDKVITGTLPPPPAQFQFPIHATRNGDLLLSDHQHLEVVRWDVKGGRALEIIGKPGALPGQFGDIGGLAEDSSGRIYIADTINRVIQRFGTDGKIDAVWSAKDPNESGEAGERR